MPTDFDFNEFLSSQKANQLTHGNVSERKMAWLKQIESLYSLVRTLLQPYTSKGAMEIRTSSVEIREEMLGAYSVSSLIIGLGGSDVRFVPVGTYLLGSPGRIDLVGLKGTVRFVLVLPELVEPKISVNTILEGMTVKNSTSKSLDISRFEWKISSLPPRIKYTKIDAVSLQNSIVEATNGKYARF